jgi:hypothetical protein
MITGKTIGQLTQLSTMTPDTLIPVELSGSTYCVSHSILTSSSSFSSRISGLETASGSFSTRVSNLKIDSGSFSTRTTALERVTGNITGDVVTKNSGSWTLSTGANTVSFTVPIGNTYTMWVNGNIPNGICVWNATVTVTNTNVPVIGQQFAWYYLAGNALALTSIPAQIIGTAGTISTTSPAVGTTTNVFTFGITNNSETSQTVNYGWNKIS